MNNLILKEELLPLKKIPKAVRELFQGVRRLIDDKGATHGFFFDNDAMEELAEDTEYSSPEFWKRIEASRKSGRVSGTKVKKELGLK